MLGISPDDQVSHQAFKSKFNLPFKLLIDADHKVSEAYGAWGERTRDDRTYMGMIRSHFVVDEQGKLIDVNVNVSPNDSVSRAMELLRK